MWKKLLILIVLLLAAFLIYVAMQPSEFVIARETVVSAPASKVFPLVNNAKQMNSWNPWMELDPNAQISFSGPEEGVGSVTAWKGGSQLGTGSATVIESVPEKLVTTRLDYKEPFEMTQTANISLQDEGGSTRVRWSVGGHQPFLGRVMCTLMNGKKMVEETFDRGLAKLKTLAEKA